MLLFGDVARKVYGLGIIGNGRRERINLKHAKITKMITLPWPDKSLSQNARVHWSKRAKATKAAREYAGWATKAAKIKIEGDGAIYLHVYFYPPDNRRRDGTNMLGSSKAIFDGIADALGVDDVRFHVSYEVCLAKSPGMVKIVVTG